METCIDCESDTTSKMINYRFPYGTLSNRVWLIAKVPLYTCDMCGEQWLNHIAEDAMQSAIYTHLAKLPP